MSGILKNMAKRVLPAPVRSRAGSFVRERRERALDHEFARFLGQDIRALDRYRAEIRASGLFATLRDAERWFDRNVHGRSLTGKAVRVGGLTPERGSRLYALVRTVRPDVAVETGVCNGFSTAFILLALEKNRVGKLHSIDMPEIAGQDYPPGTFAGNKGGAVVPPGKEPGWVVPDELRARWELRLGRTHDELPTLLAELGSIGLFLHDSDHSYENMMFEFSEAFPALDDGGVLIADDAFNPAFAEFAATHHRKVARLGNAMLIIRK
jgi:predicted O-methyltransferase YrrM